MTSTSLTSLFIAVACAGCNSFTYYEHAPTDNLRKGNDRIIRDANFQDSLEFVDQDILFIPQVHELAWEDDHRSFVLLASKRRSRIKVERVSIRNDGGFSATLPIHKTFEVGTKDESSNYYYGVVPAIFEHAAGINDVLSGDGIRMLIHYRAPVSGRLKTMQFELEKSVKTGTTLHDILSAS